jgi:hypothetical protein
MENYYDLIKTLAQACTVKNGKIFNSAHLTENSSYSADPSAGQPAGTLTPKAKF